MTQAQKIKAYDEAYKVAESIHRFSSDPAEIKRMEQIFPELKENEDKQHRKWILEYLYDGLRKSDEQFKGQFKAAIAWLERQGEQGNNEDEAILHRFSFYSYKDEPNILYLAGLYVNDKYRNKGIGTKILEVADEVAKSLNCRAIRLKTKKGSNAERLYQTHGYNSLVIKGRDKIWLEKQSEQKPTDKVEPKFKVGDWIYHEISGNTFHINKIENDLYVSDEGATISLGRQNDWRIWTIEDAKDGDVLAFNDGTSGVLIYKDNLENGGVLSHCRIIRNSFIDKEESGWGSTLLSPATKEQRDTLMKAMADAEYTFDFEKKELKKIEQKSKEKTKFYDSMDDLIADALIKEIENSELDGRSKHNRIFWIKSHRQNPAWSEEDEDAIGMAIIALEDMYDEDAPNTTYGGYNLPFNKAAERLKSLKERYTWKPSDEQMDVLLNEVTAWTKGCPKQIVLESLYNDLKKQKC